MVRPLSTTLILLLGLFTLSQSIPDRRTKTVPSFEIDRHVAKERIKRSPAVDEDQTSDDPDNSLADAEDDREILIAKPEDDSLLEKCIERPPKAMGHFNPSALALLDSLCQYFGSKIVKGFVDAIDVEAIDSSDKNDQKAFEETLENIRPKIQGCLDTANELFDETEAIYYHAQCVSKFVAKSDALSQVVWLVAFPETLRFLERATKVYQRMSELAKILTRAGVLQNWDRPEFQWAKNIAEEWRKTPEKSDERLEKMMREAPRLEEQCQLSVQLRELLRGSRSKDCLTTIIGNLLIVEDTLREDGKTLSHEFFEDGDTFQRLLAAVKSALKSTKTQETRKTLEQKDELSIARSKVNQLRRDKVRCLNALRERVDKANTRVTDVMNSSEASECVREVIERVESLEVSLVELNPSLSREFTSLNVSRLQEKIEEVFVRSLLRNYEKVKFLRPIIRDRVAVSKKMTFPDFSWAKRFEKKWRELEMISDADARLEETFRTVGNETSWSPCDASEEIEESGRSLDDCWMAVVNEIVLVESLIATSGVTLQTIFMGEPLLMNLVYMVDEELSVKDDPQTTRRKSTSFRKSLFGDELKVDGSVMAANSHDYENLAKKVIEVTAEELFGTDIPLQADEAGSNILEEAGRRSQTHRYEAESPVVTNFETSDDSELNHLEEPMMPTEIPTSSTEDSYPELHSPTSGDDESELEILDEDEYIPQIRLEEEQAVYAAVPNISVDDCYPTFRPPMSNDDALEMTTNHDVESIPSRRSNKNPLLDESAVHSQEIPYIRFINPFTSKPSSKVSDEMHSDQFQNQLAPEGEIVEAPTALPLPSDNRDDDYLVPIQSKEPTNVDSNDMVPHQFQRRLKTDDGVAPISQANTLPRFIAPDIRKSSLERADEDGNNLYRQSQQEESSIDGIFGASKRYIIRAPKRPMKKDAPRKVKTNGRGEGPSRRYGGDDVQETSGRLIDVLKNPLLQSLITASTGIQFDTDANAKTIIAGILGRVTDIFVYPIVGDVAGRAIRGGVQGSFALPRSTFAVRPLHSHPTNDVSNDLRDVLRNLAISENNPLLRPYVEDLQDIASNLLAPLLDDSRRSGGTETIRRPENVSSNGTVDFLESYYTNVKGNREECLDDVDTSRLPEKIDDMLCAVFGREGRADIINSESFQRLLAVKADNQLPNDINKQEELYLEALYDLEPAYMKCMKELRKTNITRQGLWSYARSPKGCVKTLATTSTPISQMAWLLYLPRTLWRISMILGNRERVKPAMEKIEELTDGQIHNALAHPDFNWARNKINIWKSVVNDTERRKWFFDLRSEGLRGICEPSKPLEELISSHNWDECLRSYMGNLLVLETFLQKHGQSLEFTFASDVSVDVSLANLVTLIKEVLDSKFLVIAPDQDQIFTLNLCVLECQDTLRVEYDLKPRTFEELYRTEEVARCMGSLQRVEIDTIGLRNVENLPVNRQQEIRNIAEQKAKFNRLHMQSLLYSYIKLRPINEVFVNSLLNKVLDQVDQPQFKWVKDLMSTWREVKLENRLRHMISVFGRSIINRFRKCEADDPEDHRGELTLCWKNVLEGLLIIESSLMKEDLTLQMAFFNDDLFVNLSFMARRMLDENHLQKLLPVLQMDENASRNADDKIVATINEYRRTAGKMNQALRRLLPVALNDTDRTATYHVGVNFYTEVNKGIDSISSGRRDMRSRFVDDVSNVMIGGVTGAVAGVTFGAEISSSTIIGGMVGRMAEILTYPLLGDTGSLNIRHTLQGVIDGVGNTVKGIFGA